MESRSLLEHGRTWLLPLVILIRSLSLTCPRVSDSLTTNKMGRTYGREVSWANTVYADIEISPREFSREHLGQLDSSSPKLSAILHDSKCDISSLGRVVVELTPLRSLTQPTQTSDIDNISRFGEITDSLCCCEKREEGEC